MASKTVPFIKKPAKSADEWVGEGGAAPAKAVAPSSPAEPIKRLTLDLPESLHRRIKLSCVARGTHMVEEIRALLETRFPANESLKA